MAKILVHELSAARIAWKRYQKPPVRLAGASLVFCAGPSSVNRRQRPPHSQLSHDAEPPLRPRSGARNFAISSRNPSTLNTLSLLKNLSDLGVPSSATIEPAGRDLGPTTSPVCASAEADGEGTDLTEATTADGLRWLGPRDAVAIVQAADLWGASRTARTNLDFCRAQAVESAVSVVLSPSIVGLINSATPGIFKTLSNIGLSAGTN